MRQRGRRLLICGAVLAALGAGVALASATAPVFAIPGFTAARLQVGGISRLDDGGGLIAGSLADRARSPDWRPAIVRLHVDGSVDLGYGSEGISILGVGADARATSLATDPRTGEAWIGVTADPGGRGAIVALDGQGGRRHGFARHGALTLGARNAPVALAWRADRLLVASGTQPCTGCRLSLIESTTGKVLATGGLSPAVLTGRPGCARGSVTSAVLTDPRSAQLAFAGTQQCTAQLVTVSIPGSGARGALRATATPIGGTASADLVAASGSDICLATASGQSTELGRFVPSRRAFTQSRAPGGRLIALVALGQGACAALIATGRQPGGLVVQASLQRRQPTSDTVPRSVEPLGMFRCHAHLLVIGAGTRNHQQDGVVAVIPVRRGPKAAMASAAVAIPRSGRCT